MDIGKNKYNIPWTTSHTLLTSHLEQFHQNQRPLTFIYLPHYTSSKLSMKWKQAYINFYSCDIINATIGTGNIPRQHIATKMFCSSRNEMLVVSRYYIPHAQANKYSNSDFAACGKHAGVSISSFISAINFTRAFSGSIFLSCQFLKWATAESVSISSTITDSHSLQTSRNSSYIRDRSAGGKVVTSTLF